MSDNPRISTPADPKLLTDEERALLDVYRGSRMRLSDAVEAMAGKAYADASANPQPAPGDLDAADDFDPTYAEARPLALKICRWAVADWREAEKRLAEANRLQGDSECRHGCGPDARRNDDEFDKWVEACVFFMCDARDRVSACVLMALGWVESPLKVAELPKDFMPCALELDGSTLVVIPESEESNRPVLTVIEGDAFQSCQYGGGQ